MQVHHTKILMFPIVHSLHNTYILIRIIKKNIISVGKNQEGSIITLINLKLLLHGSLKNIQLYISLENKAHLL